MNRAFAIIIVGLVAATWAAYLLLQGETLTWSYLGPFSLAVGVLTGAGVVFKHLAWHWPVVHFLTKTPHITGTWIGKLRSDYIHEGETEPRGAIDAVLVVTQTADEINIRQYTKESSSTTVTASVTAEPGDKFILATVFLNEPDIELQQTRSRMHYGATRFSIEGPPRSPEQLVGNYWTARKTSGSLEFQLVSRKRAHSFEHAYRLQKALK
ncbi:hypothetical protein [Halomonas sp. GT]|uniref:Cap15 family cyclic dinucleotide receptor domain-containing protein n=1 Tax=Halomonas sp. GT TaxID=1971364 RepID=UPI0009F29AD6